MKLYELRREQKVNADINTAWDFFSSPQNLNRITPPGIDFKIITEVGKKMYQGQIIEYKIKILPLFYSRWISKISYIKENEVFIDEQISGPYKFWHHRHEFKVESDSIFLIDHVHYMVPYGILGRILHLLYIKRKLAEIFNYRADAVEKLFGQ